MRHYERFINGRGANQGAERRLSQGGWGLVLGAGMLRFGSTSNTLKTPH